MPASGSTFGDQSTPHPYHLLMMVAAAAGELSIVGWLLIKGASEDPVRPAALAARGGNLQLRRTAPDSPPDEHSPSQSRPARPSCRPPFCAQLSLSRCSLDSCSDVHPAIQVA